MMEWFETTFAGQMPIWEIRERVALKQAWKNGVSIFEHDESSDMEGVFEDIAVQLEEVA